MGVNLTPMPPLTRQEGWEARLAAVVEAARATPYKLGEHDCVRLAMAAVRALTGHDAWPQFAGTYATRRDAMRLLAAYGKDFASAFSWLFSVPAAPMALAMRGDVCHFVARGEHHLGVCIGQHVAVMVEAGLAYVPRSACTQCWRIG